MNDIFNKATRLTGEQRSQLMQWLNQIQEAGALSRRINDVARDFSDGGTCRVPAARPARCAPRVAAFPTPRTPPSRPKHLSRLR